MSVKLGRVRPGKTSAATMMGLLLASALVAPACSDDKTRAGGADGPRATDGPRGDAPLPGTDATVDAPRLDGPRPDAPRPADAPAASDAPVVACAGNVTPTPIPVMGMGGTIMSSNATSPNNARASCDQSRRTGGGEQVFRYDVQRAGDVVITVTPGTSLDAILSVRRSCGDAMSEIACVDRGSGGQADTITLQDLEPGPLYIFVDGYDRSTGTFSLRVEERVSACGSAPMLTLDAPMSGTTMGRPDLASSVCGGSMAGEQLFRVVQTSAGPLQLDVTTMFDGVVYIRSACSDPLADVACGRVNGTSGRLIVPSLPAGTYYVFVDGFGTGSGAFSITASRPTATSSCGAMASLPVPGTVMGSTSGVGMTGGSCRASSALGGAPEAIYSASVPAGNDLVVDATGMGGYDVVLYARRDCAMAASELACEDGRVQAERLVVRDPGGGPVAVFVDGTADFGSSAAGAYSLSTSLRPVRPAGQPCPTDDSARCADGHACIAGTCTARAQACAGATDVTPLLMGGMATVTGTTTGASSAIEPACSMTRGRPEALYRITLAQAGTLTVETNFPGTSFDTAVALLSGDCATAVACAATTPNGSSERATLLAPMLPAGTYVVAIDGERAPGAGTFEAHFTVR